MLLQRLWRLWPQPHCLLRAIANKVSSCCLTKMLHSVMSSSLSSGIVLSLKVEEGKTQYSHVFWRKKDSRTCQGISSATACALRPWRSHASWIHSLQHMWTLQPG